MVWMEISLIYDSFWISGISELVGLGVPNRDILWESHDAVGRHKVCDGLMALIDNEILRHIPSVTTKSQKLMKKRQDQ